MRNRRGGEIAFSQGGFAYLKFLTSYSAISGAYFVR